MSKVTTLLLEAEAHLTRSKVEKFTALLNRPWMDKPEKWEELTLAELDEMFSYWIQNGKLPTSAL